MIIGLIGLGEMGSEIGRYLVMNDLEVISVFEGRSDLSKKRALNYGIKDAGSIEKLCMKSDIILSIIPPDKAIETAESYTSYKNKNGQIYCIICFLLSDHGGILRCFFSMFGLMLKI